MANDNKLVNLADLKEAFDNLKINASRSAAGLMSAADKTKLDGIAAGAQVNSITGVKGNSENSYRTGNVNLTSANIGAVEKSGDTMTGDLTVENSGESNIASKCTDSGVTVYLNSYNTGLHGVYSSGYNKGDGLVEDGKYLIARRPGGKVEVADHYDKDGVNALGVLYTDVNIGNVTVNASGYMDIVNKIPSGITPIAASILDFGTATGAISVIASGRYIMGTPSATATNVKIRYFYRRQ